MPDKKPLVLLDRDGTLITEQNYLKDPQKVRLLAGAAPGLRRLARAGFPLVIVTNQSGVGRGLMTRPDVDRVHRRLTQLLKRQGVKLSGIYWCPHRPGAGCRCRKPRLSLVRKAARDLKRSWRRSISVGDKWSDVVLGQRTGGSGILVLTGIGRQALADNPGGKVPDYVARNFASAAAWILKSQRKEPGS